MEDKPLEKEHAFREPYQPPEPWYNVRSADPEHANVIPPGVPY